MPASRFYDSTQSYNKSINHSPLHNEYQNKASSTIHKETRRVPSSLYNDPTLFEEEQPVSESQSQYSNIAAPLEPRPSNSNNNINGRPEHIVI